MKRWLGIYIVVFVVFFSADLISNLSLDAEHAVERVWDGRVLLQSIILIALFMGVSAGTKFKAVYGLCIALSSLAVLFFVRMVVQVVPILGPLNEIDFIGTGQLALIAIGITLSLLIAWRSASSMVRLKGQDYGNPV